MRHGVTVWAVWLQVVRVGAQSGSPRLRQLVVRFSEEELREIRGAAAVGRVSVGAWVGQTGVRRGM